MLFRKKQSRSCIYCGYSTELSNGNLLCAKKGILTVEKPCSKFDYEPTKRIPGKMKAPDFSKYDKDDFTL